VIKGNSRKLAMTFLLTLVCSFSLSAQDQSVSSTSELTGLNRVLDDANTLPASPLAPAGSMAPFDLGDSNKPQLRLQLSEPLFFEASSLELQSTAGRPAMGITGVLGANINDEVSVGVSQSIFEYQPAYTTLGDIHCENGTLDAESYHASNCRFIGDSLPDNQISNQIMTLGAEWSPSAQFLVGLNYFRQHAELANNRNLTMLNPTPIGSGLPWQDANPLNGLNSRTEGVDLNLQLGFTTNQYGSLQLGLQFSRIVDSEFSMFNLNNGSPLRWLPAEPFSTAQMNLDWSRGDFSGGIQGFYRGDVEMGENPALNGLSSFDLYFTWRTPWNADLSVGASNLLNSGNEKSSDSNQEQFDDPFEMIYGRVPYVRYKQDL
jgi:hypothetical protein